MKQAKLEKVLIGVAIPVVSSFIVLAVTSARDGTVRYYEEQAAQRRHTESLRQQVTLAAIKAEHEQAAARDQFAWSYYYEQQRLAREQREQMPVLELVGSRRTFTDCILSLHNTSSTRHANVSSLRFTVTDRECLEYIQRVSGPPTPSTGIGAANHVDSIVFRHGAWKGSSFEFCADVGLNVPPGPATDLQLAIINRPLAGVRFIGELDIGFDVHQGHVSHFTVQNVTIIARAE